MGVDREHLRVDRQPERVLHLVPRRSGRDVDRLVAQEHGRRRPARRGVRKVEAHRRRDALGNVRRRQVQLKHQVDPGIEAPGQVVGLERRDSARRPGEQVPVREAGVIVQVVGVARRGVPAVEAAGGPGRVDEQPRVVNCLPPRPEVECPHMAGRLQRDRKHEVAVLVLRTRREFIRLGQFDYQIRRAELPCGGPGGGRDQVGGFPLDRALLHPATDDRDVSFVESALSCERAAVTRRGLPGRHRASGGRLPDRPRPGTHVFVGDEAERGRAAVAVAGRAVGVQNRRHVPRERRRLGSGRPARRRGHAPDTRRQDPVAQAPLHSSGDASRPDSHGCDPIRCPSGRR